nr:triadin-like [Aegilops tauschii subsp. strangulata]
MSEGSDSQNKSEENVNLSEGTSPSNISYDDGSRSTPNNLPKATTRTRKKRTSESEDEDFVIEEEVTSKKKVIKKEYVAAAATRAGQKQKLPAKRAPVSKIRQSRVAQEQEAVAAASGAGKEKKERKGGRWCELVGPMAEFEKHSSNEDEEEEEPAAPPPKTQKLMGYAIRTWADSSKPKSAPKPSAQDQAPKPSSPKRSTRKIPAAEENKAPVLEAQEDEEEQVLRKLKPKIPDTMMIIQWLKT